ncbi:MAG: tRNA 2-thiouridine(34) synthase MnmA [Brevefilum sp.]
MSVNRHVFVAMSGGVDSAVAAARLMVEGYQVTGIHMETWQDPKWQAKIEHLPGPIALAQDVAEKLGIPFVSLDVRERFYEKVVQSFIQKYLKGQTPNPCLFCNPQVKWGILQTYALEHGGDFFATGHYARIERLESGKVRLKRGEDRTKDQSYVLCMLSQSQLERSLLPLGEVTKDEVRAEARRLGLPVADRQDSQDLCFLGDVDYRDFLQRFAPDFSEPGEIITVDGNVVGQHQGLAHYTIGQRKGIRVAAEEPYYVVGKDIERNRLVVGFADRTGKSTLIAVQPNWISGQPPNTDEIYYAMIRYRAKRVPAMLKSVTEKDFRLEFKGTLRGITPGQVVALYSEDVCLGGGVIVSSG